MRKLIFILVVIFSSLINTYSQGWVQLNSGTSSTLPSIWFVNQNTGYCSGINIILKTTNAGFNWFTTYTGPGAANLQFINENTGFAIGGGGVIKTTNAGINWQNYNTPFSPESIYIVDSLIGYGCGSPYKIMKTFDGGLTWYSIAPGINNYDFHSVYFLNVNTGYIGGGRDEKPNVFYIIRSTTNGGINWSSVLNGNGNHITSLFFANENTGFAIAAIYVYKTTNMGSSWSLVSSVGAQNELFSIYFPTPNTGFAVGNGLGNSGRIWATTNGGINWNLSFLQSPGQFNSVYFLDVNTGYVCGNYGTILKTTSGGLTFIQPISNEIPSQYSLSQNYPNPFNPSTKIKFQVPPLNLPLREGDREGVILKIYDMMGREITTLINQQLTPGTYEVEWSAEVGASNYPSGIYFYKLTSGDFTETRKMVLLK